ncbi:MAG: ABC transporter substrate-binding protein [Salinivirgaceae bacterium]|nr:ABC transporter substrate-binding protein [Salinivirgaceae bacterium]
MNNSLNSKHIVLLLIGSLIVFSCSNSKNDHHRIFTYNESKGIPTLDPAFARNQTIIWPASNLFNGLVQTDTLLNVIPCIAKNWNLDADKKTYTFTLSNNVYFHSHSAFGDKKTRAVVAQDFVYSFNRLTNPTTGSPGAWVFNIVDTLFGDGGFKALNDSSLQIRLNKPFVPFLGMLTMTYCSVVPQEVVELLGHKFGQNPIGTGPFKFHMWDLNDRLIFLKNPHYFESDSMGNPLPYLDAVHISFIADKQSEFMEFMLGNIDFISGIHATNKDELLTRAGKLRERHHKTFYMQTAPYLNSEYLGFIMNENHPDYVELKVRQALNYAFSRERMIAYLRNNLAVPATATLTPPMLYPKGTKHPQGFTFDQSKARELLKEAGYEGGKGLKPITLTTTPDYLDIGEYIQHEALQIGIQIEIETATGAAFRQKVANGELAFFRASWIADYPHAENYLLLFSTENKSPAGPNYTQFSNPKFDALYYKIAQDDDAKMLIPMADSIVISETPVIPLFYDVVVRFVNNKITNFDVNALNNINLKHVRKSAIQD